MFDHHRPWSNIIIAITIALLEVKTAGARKLLEFSTVRTANITRSTFHVQALNNETNTTSQTQRESMTTIFTSFGLSSEIKVDRHECEWKGVFCGETNTTNSTVERLILISLGLSTTIPTEIGLLMSLRDFDVGKYTII